MTKQEYQKYNKVVTDKYGNQIKPGDIVVFPDGYYNDCHIGTVSHFTESNVIILYENNRYGKDVYKAQRASDRIIKIKDGNSESPAQNNNSE